MNIVLLYLLLLKGTVTAFAGLASLPVIQESLVNHHHVLTNEQLNEAVVITRSSPGGRSIAQNGLPVFRRRLVAGAERAHRRHVSADGSRFGELFHLLRGRHTPTDGPIGHGSGDIVLHKPNGATMSSAGGFAPDQSFLSFMLRHGGWGVALRAFFDETGTHDGHPLTAVAGFLFDGVGLDKFEADWRKRTADLKESFHTVDCVHGRGQFKGWPEPQRLLLMHDLPEIIIQTRICGFLSFIESNEYDQWCKENPRYVSRIGSPYTVCLMKCVETAGLVARQSQFDGDIDYVFESGCDKQQEAAEFMLRLDKNPKLKAGLRVGKWGFSPKKSELALSAADFLCWEWQRNYVQATQNLADVSWNPRSEFQILLSPNPTEIYHQRISKENLSSQAMTNAAHGIHV